MIEDPAGAIADQRVRDFGVLLSAAARLERIAGKVLEQQCGISHVVFEVLLRLGGAWENRMSITDISQHMVLTSGGMTRLIDRMEGAGLVKREPSANDRRVQLVRLTENGRCKLVEAARAHVQTLDEHFVAPLEADDLASMVRSLDVLDAAARGAPAPQRS